MQAAPKDVPYRKGLASHLYCLQDFLAGEGRPAGCGSCGAAGPERARAGSGSRAPGICPSGSRSGLVTGSWHTISRLRPAARKPSNTTSNPSSSSRGWWPNPRRTSTGSRSWRIPMASSAMPGRTVDEFQEAEAAYRQAVSLQETLVQAAPGDVNHRKALASYLNNLADLVWANGRLPEAEPVLPRGLAALRGTARRGSCRAGILVPGGQAKPRAGPTGSGLRPARRGQCDL